MNVTPESVFGGIEYNYAAAKAHAMYLGWVDAIAPVLATHDVLSVEEEFQFPLLNPETEAPSKTFLEAGKIDGVLRCKVSGAIKIIEHKTTSEDVSTASNYWSRLAIDTQISKYVLAQIQKGLDVRSVVYDVIKKPGNRPLRSGKDNAETPDEFRARCLAVIKEDPALFYVQKEIPRSDADLLEYMGDAWALSQQILYYRRAKLWPRNPQACTAYGTCEYFDLCAGRSSVDGIRFDKKARKHAELEITEPGKEFLTNSRLSALRKCSRFHYLKYEDPTERIGEDNEAIRIGSLFHAAAEIHLKSFLVQ